MTHPLGVLLALMMLASCIGACAPTAAAPTDLATSVETALPTDDTPSPAPPSARAEPTGAPTIAPEPTLGGEFPGPDATVHPRAAVLRGVRLDELARLWASLGLSCLSHSAGGPESPAAYNVHCERIDLATNVHVATDTGYWTSDAIATLAITATPSDDGSIDGPAAATESVIPFARLAGGDAAVGWLQQHVEDPSCPDGCNELFRGSQFSYRFGHLGTQSLHVWVPLPTQ